MTQYDIQAPQTDHPLLNISNSLVSDVGQNLTTAQKG